MLRVPRSTPTKGCGVTQSDVSPATTVPESPTSASTRSTGGRSSRAADADVERPARAPLANGGPAQLGELEEIDPRNVFPRDGDAFTNWLSANLDKLARELGITGLREVGRDIAVGGFTVDLLAQTDKGRRVAVENQLEPSDHPHLGQVITYAAGLEVGAVIWIATRISEEHRAVLDWLNQHSDDDVRFFGVELRLFKVGNSLPGAFFHVECRPNDWQKVVRQRQRVGSPFNARAREF
jgi:hypothetical protein